MYDKNLNVIFGINTSFIQNDNWTFVPLFKIQLYFVISKDHKLRKKKKLSFSDLNGENFICPCKENKTTDFILKEFKEKCSNLKVTFSNALDQLLIKVGLNKDFSIIPESEHTNVMNILYIPANIEFSCKFGLNIKNHNSSDTLKYFVTSAQRIFNDKDIKKLF